METTTNNTGFNDMQTTVTNDAGFLASRASLETIVGTKLDNAQYISMLLKGEAEKARGKVGLGTIVTKAGRKYNLSVSGQPTATNSNGENVQTHSVVGALLKEGRENELNYDTLAYLEAEGETPTGKRYIGVYYSIADARQHILEEAEKGEL